MVTRQNHTENGTKVKGRGGGGYNLQTYNKDKRRSQF